MSYLSCARMAYFGYSPIIHKIKKKKHLLFIEHCFLLLAILHKQHITQGCAIVTINSNSSAWRMQRQCHGFYSQVKHEPINVCVNINTLRNQFYLFTLNCVIVTLVLSWFIAFIQMNHDSNSDFSFLQRMHSPQSLSPPPQDTLSSHQHNYHNYTVALHSLRISTEDKPVNLFLTS